VLQFLLTVLKFNHTSLWLEHLTYLTLALDIISKEEVMKFFSDVDYWKAEIKIEWYCNNYIDLMRELMSSGECGCLFMQ